nr:unnamed protein product [Callosobruchus analis]
MHINIQSITNKVNLVELLLQKYSPSIMCVSEHWLSEGKIACFYINSYKKISSFCRVHSSHGGTAIFVHNAIASYCKEDSILNSYSLELHMECSVISYKQTNCIINIYRSPSGDFHTFASQFSQLMSQVCRYYNFIILCGDLNIHNDTTSKEFKVLNDILSSLNLKSLVNTPTRVTDTSCSIIDYVITSNSEYTKVDNFDPGLSDHFCQLVHLSVPVCDPRHDDSQREKFLRRINASTMNEFNYLISKYELPSEGTMDIETLFEHFFEHVYWAFDVACPKVRSKNINYNKKIVFPPELIKELDSLKDLSWLSKHIDEPSLKEKYRHKKKVVATAVKDEKIKQNQTAIDNSTNKSKSTWNIVNRINTKQEAEKHTIVISDGTNKIENEKHVAELFANHFTTIVDSTLNAHFSSNLSRTCSLPEFHNKSYFFYPIDAPEVSALIGSLPNKKSTDDTTALITGDNEGEVKHKTEIVIKDFHSWCNMNKLMLNIQKTRIIHFNSRTKKRNLFNINLNSQTISEESSAIFLGTKLDSHLAWEPEIEAISKKLNKAFFVINTLKNNIAQKSLMTVYYAFVYSAIAYNIVVWGQSTEVSRIFIHQKRILRLIYNLNYNDSCREVFRKNKIFTVTAIYLFKLLSHIKRNREKYINNGFNHHYSTRCRDEICLEKFNHSFFFEVP